MTKYKQEFKPQQKVVYTPKPKSGASVEEGMTLATVLGYRPEYNVYAIKLHNSEVIVVDAETLKAPS